VDGRPITSCAVSEGRRVEVCSALDQEIQAAKPSLFTPDSGFIVVRVRLAICLEEMLIPQEGLRLTKLFEESHPRAGRGGHFVFMVSLVVMTVVSCIVVRFFLWRFIEDFGKV
jgi:hypothetical protein